MPLVFAFIVGKTIKSYAHWRLQRGEHIGFLDNLFGSTTMTGTVTTMIDSRRVGIVGLILTLMWSLSPLGGQATLRVVLQNPEAIESVANMSYMTTSVALPGRLMELSTYGEEVPINALFYGSVGASAQVKNSSLDSWGNIKIPMIEHLPQNPQRDPGNDWISVDDDPSSLVYASLLGIPVANVPQEHNSTFTIETSYLKTDCAIQVSGSNLTKVIMDACASSEQTWNGTYLVQDSDEGCHTQFKWGDIGYIRPRGPLCKGRETAARLLYNPWPEYYPYRSEDKTLANCTLTTSFVEVRVACIGWDCRPVEMRHSVSPDKGNTYGTFLDSCPRPRASTPLYFFNLFKTTTEGSRSDNSQTAIQGFLENPETALNVSAVHDISYRITVGEETFSIRMAQLLNTYWIAILGSEASFLGHPADFSNVSVFRDTDVADTQATISTGVIILRYDAAWMGVLVVSVVVLLLAAVVGVVLDLNIQVPRLLMNVSTLTRGNPNFGIPVGGGALSDEARARLLADVKVRFGEVEDKDDGPYLVIGDCAENGGRVVRLTKGKVYGG